MASQTFVVYVEDRPGVLNRVASLCRRRGFNIESLSVGHTETTGVSRMTIVVDTDGGGARRIEAHLGRLVNVLGVQNITASPVVCRDLVMIKVAADAQAMVAFAEAFGGLDILHNNAGIITGRPRFPDTEPERWSRVLDINLRGVILGTQYGIRAMRRRGGGVIINTASMAGIGWGFPPDPVYAASKGGVVLFTASLAPLKDELNIRVNCVCPGVVDTPMTQRSFADAPAEEDEASERLRLLPLIQPEEVADAVVQLIQDDSLAGRAIWIRNGMPRELR